MDQQSAEKAIEVLEAQRQRLEETYRRDIAELDRTIASIRVAAERNGAGTKRGAWAGMTIAAAMQAFLGNYEGSAAPMQEVVDALLAGGVDLGKVRSMHRYRANVKTTVSNSPKRFKYNKKKDTVELIRKR